jgi:Protein of unknown function (DUF2806)
MVYVLHATEAPTAPAYWYDGMNNHHDDGALFALREFFKNSLGFQLPPLPTPPRTAKNLDQACAALLDYPSAPRHVNADFANRGAIADAMRRQLRGASNEKVAAALEGLVADYVEKRDRRTRVLELAAQEIMQASASVDADRFLDDDWMAFFKSKVDHLATDESKLFFGKVLAGEIKRPGSFSKRSLNILAEMGSRVGHLFDTLCNISTVVSMRHVRVMTLGLGDVGENSLQEFGLPFEALNHLIEAGLIFSEYNTFVDMPHAALGHPFELGGDFYCLHVAEARKAELDTPDKRAAALGAMPGVTLSAAGRELRAIVAKRTVHAYVEKLANGFAELGFDLQVA